MANDWGGRIIRLDTQNDDGSYTASNDVKNGGGKYSTLRYKVKKAVVIDAADGDVVVLKQCNSTDFTGEEIFNIKAETGSLSQQVDFPGGLWVKGIIPTTIDNSCKVDIYLC